MKPVGQVEQLLVTGSKLWPAEQVVVPPEPFEALPNGMVWQ